MCVDKLNNAIIKEIGPSIANGIVIAIKISIEYGHVRNCWKTANILYKYTLGKLSVIYLQ